jgi:excisionase family DNA binding protein
VSERLTLSVAEAASLLGVGRNHLYSLINEGQIPHVRFGRLIKIPREALEDWLKNESGVGSSAK